MLLGANLNPCWTPLFSTRDFIDFALRFVADFTSTAAGAFFGNDASHDVCVQRALIDTIIYLLIAIFPREYRCPYANFSRG